MSDQLESLSQRNSPEPQHQQQYYAQYDDQYDETYDRDDATVDNDYDPEAMAF
jgi:hypothetical protein